MATHLYETLELPQGASPEEIRRAYRRKALETHPDRLKAGATPADKKDAEERFTAVNHAYEVLSNETKRKAYDRHGQWPPPQEYERGAFDRDRHHRHHRHRSNTHGDPFGAFGHTSSPFGERFFPSDPFGFSFGVHHRSSSPRTQFAFTDPFALFNQTFGDLNRIFDDAFFSDMPGPFGHRPSLFPPHPFDRIHGMSGMLPQMDTVFPSAVNPRGDVQNAAFSSASRSVFTRGPSGNGQWVSQSKSSRTINGVTETVIKRTDSNGNEHVTHTSPDGRERYLINGIEQPSRMLDRNIQGPPPPYPGPPPSPTRNQMMEHVREHDKHRRSESPYNSANIRDERERFADQKHRVEREYNQSYAQDNGHDRHNRKHWWRRH